MDTVLNIAIIGAGIGGLASAIYLARSGHNVSIFERFNLSNPFDAGLLLQPPGQAVLADLGILDEIKGSCATITALNSKTSHGKTIFDLAYRDLDDIVYSGLGIERNRLYRAMIDKAVDASVKITLGAEIDHIDDISGQVSSPAKGYGNHDAIIIASGVRDLLCDKFIKRIKKQNRWSCLWANVTLPSDCPTDVLSQRCKSTHHVTGLLPLEHNRDGSTTAAFFWSLRGRRVADWRAQEYQHFVDGVAAIWPSAAEAIEPLSHRDFSYEIYYDSWCKKPWKNKVITIGDAIHSTNPLFCQGATMALMDAKILASAFASQESLENVYCEFWRNREKQLNFTRKINAIMTPFFQSHSKLLGMLRDASCHYFTKSGVGQRLALTCLASQRDSFFSL